MAKTIPSGVPPTRNKSWRPGQKGQGGEGMSKGYGGSAGPGTGPSGPDADQETETQPDEKANRGRGNKRTAEKASPSLPSQERIAKVLR